MLLRLALRNGNLFERFVMNLPNQRRPRLVHFAAALLGILFLAAGVVSAAPAGDIAETAPKWYLAYAISPSLMRASEAKGEEESAQPVVRAAIDQCNKDYEVKDCVQAGWTDDSEYLALAATATPNGPWGYKRDKTPDAAYNGAVELCVSYGGTKEDCHVIKWSKTWAPKLAEESK